jgi:hypothetical protein
MKVNLVKRGILVMEATNCCSGCGIAELTQHLFFECPLFSNVWHGIARWFGVNIVFHNEIKKTTFCILLV